MLGLIAPLLLLKPRPLVAQEQLQMLLLQMSLLKHLVDGHCDGMMAQRELSYTPPTRSLASIFIFNRPLLRPKQG